MPLARDDQWQPSISPFAVAVRSEIGRPSLTRPLRSVAVAVVGVALLSGPVGSMETSFASRDWWEAVDRAVVAGSVKNLRGLRQSAKDATERTGSDSLYTRYALAFANWRLSQALESARERKRLLKEAQKQLDELLRSDPQTAEAHALRGR